MYHNFLALAYKIPNISSLSFANIIKHALNQKGYKIDKIGFSGTLDPFAQGQLILGVNQYTKLLHHIKKDYKTYKAVLFLGLESASLDTENIIGIHEVQHFSLSQVNKAMQPLIGTITYQAPKFSAKHKDGIRAYKLAREQKDFEMPYISMQIQSLKLLCYNHPFISFEVCVSEGGYVRSIGEMIAKNLDVKGSLCYLERTQEGQLCYMKLLQQYKQEESFNESFKKSSFSSKKQHTEIQDYLHVSIEDSKAKQNTHFSQKFEFSQINTNDSIISLQFIHNKIQQKTKLLLIDIQNTLKYDTIKLTEYAQKAFNGAKITLDSKQCARIFQESLQNVDSQNMNMIIERADFYSRDSNKENELEIFTQSNHLQKQDSEATTQQSKIFFVDFDTHFAVVMIKRSGEIKYILNRIHKC